MRGLIKNLPAKYAKGTKKAAALFLPFHFLLLTFALGAIACSGQSTTNQIKRPCTGYQTPARVWITKAGNVEITPCVGGTSIVTGGSNITFTQGIIETSKPFITHTATWNDANVVFTNFFSNVQDTNSDNGSLLMDLQVGSASMFNISKRGRVTFPVWLPTQGTITSTTPFINHSATWNSGGTTFTNLLSNVTDTASASGSLLMDLQVGGTSKFKVGKDGTVNGVKVYRALLTQTGTNAPTAVVLENTLGGTVVWTRSVGGGVYYGTLASAFPIAKTQIFIQQNNLSPSTTFPITLAGWLNDDAIQVDTRNVNLAGGTATATDDMLVSTAITILVNP